MVSTVQLASATLAVLTFLPFVVVIPFYVNMILQASITVFIGCHMSVHDPNKSKEEQEREILTQKDVMKFPLIGSAALLSLYVLLKFFKWLVNMLLVFYFMVLGSLALSALVAPLVRPYLPSKFLRNPKEFKYQLPLLGEFKFTAAEAFCCLPSGALGVTYCLTKHWLCNNIFGIAFSLKGIEMLSLGSFVNGAILLCGLFFYDIFWVFGTDVMVSVAKGFEAPIKLLFPRDFSAPPEKMFSMLGLGDIVIPALFIALLLRWDAKREIRGYFYPVWFSYIGGLVATVVVMLSFNAAQPALLYLVPACLGSSLIVALVRGELKLLFAHKEEGPEETADSGKSDEPKSD